MAGYMAGIVLYNSELERLRLEIESVLPQVDLICLCDNGSTNIDKVEKMIGGVNRITLIKNSNNTGIGAASNQVFKYAEKMGYNWVLMLDHDTICPHNLVSTYEEYIGNDNIGMMCPNVVDKEIVHNIYNSERSEKMEYVTRCIQSATFINVSAWQKCGGFNEWMFIDFIDFDICKKMEINDYKILRCRTVTVDHKLGKRTFSKNYQVFDKLSRITGVRAIRYLCYKNEFSKERIYYCTRNNIAYIKLYSDYINIFKELTDFLYRILKRIVRSNHRIMIMKETIRGLHDGFKLKVEPYKKTTA